MKKINLQNLKNVPIKSRHVRWNWEQSPDDSFLVRYHVAVVGNKKLKEVVEKFTEPWEKLQGV